MNHTTESSSHVHQIQFTGSGSEYFNIWLANVALTIVTFGIYGPWAKVRRNKYLHKNVSIEGSALDYHADPVKIFLGRLVAIGLFIVYSVLTSLFFPWNTLGFALLIAAYPILVQKALRFRYRVTSYRNIRFAFRGSIIDGAYALVFYPACIVLSLGLLFPLAMKFWRDYQLKNGSYGSTHFGYSMPLKKFFVAGYLSHGYLLLAASFVGTLTFLSKNDPKYIDKLDPAYVYLLLPLMIIIFVWGLLSHVFRLYFKHHLIWDGLTVGPFKFVSTLRFKPCVWLVLSNGVLILLTLGFYMPFATIRRNKLIYTNVIFMGPGSIDGFVADSIPPEGAIGDEAADFLDLDIGF